MLPICHLDIQLIENLLVNSATSTLTECVDELSVGARRPLGSPVGEGVATGGRGGDLARRAVAVTFASAAIIAAVARAGRRASRAGRAAAAAAHLLDYVHFSSQLCGIKRKREKKQKKDSALLITKDFVGKKKSLNLVSCVTAAWTRAPAWPPLPLLISSSCGSGEGSSFEGDGDVLAAVPGLVGARN